MADNQNGEVLLYGYWRSSSAYRVRIALNLKSIEYQQQAVHLVRDGGEQHLPSYRDINPLGLVPALVHNGQVVVQSLAICEYLEESFTAKPLLPSDRAGRARVRSIVQTICSEIQPLNNVAVMRYLEQELKQPRESVRSWYSHWIDRGFTAIETWLEDTGSGIYCHGDEPTLADCFLVPQVYNAERFSCNLEPYPRIRQVVAQCRVMDAFERAAPENQPDAE